MVHVSDLGEDYFNYRPEIMAMVGERSGIRFNMGDEVTVRVARADLDTSKIDLTLISNESEGKKPGRGKKQTPPQNAAAAKAGQAKTAKSSSAKAAASGKQSKALKMVDGKITLVSKEHNQAADEHKKSRTAAAPAAKKPAPRKRRK